MALEGRKRSFVDHYFLCGLNGSKAAVAAGYSENRKYETASELLKDPAVRAEIDQRLKEAGMGKEEVVYRLSEIASVSVEDFFDLGFVDEPLIALLKEELAEAQKIAKDPNKSPDIREAAQDQIRRLRRSIHEAEHPTFRLNLDKARESGKLHLIKSLKWTADGRPQLELHDYHKANEQIARYHKLLTDKLDLTSDGKPLGVIGYEVVNPVANPETAYRPGGDHATEEDTA